MLYPYPRGLICGPPIYSCSCGQRMMIYPHIQNGDDDIRVISTDGRRISFPSYFPAVSPVMATLMEKAQEREDIERGRLLIPFDSQTLTLLKVLIEQLPKAAFDNGSQVPASNITNQTVFIHRELQAIISSLIENLSTAELANLFTAVDFLQITPLIRVILDEIARRILPTVRYHINQDLTQPISQVLPLPENEHGQMRTALRALWRSPQRFQPIQDLLNTFHIQKHHLSLLGMYVYLHFIGTPSFTIEEFLARFGQPRTVLDPTLNLPSINIDRNELTSLHGLSLIQDKQIGVLSLQGNRILGSDIDPYFPLHPFGSFPHLVMLNLMNNQIGELHDEVFWGLGNLTELDLNDNLISSLPANIFQGMGALTFLNLSHNQLSTLPERIFLGLTTLASLYLNHNRLFSLPAQLFQGLLGLSFLNLSFNLLVSLPNQLFQGLVALTTLDLSNNHLTSLPAQLFQGLVALNSLNLSQNQLLALPDQIFQGLVALITLDLGYNQLSSLPAQLFHGLGALGSLNLTHNLLSSLPAQLFQGLGALIGLDLSHNLLSSLPPQIFQGLGGTLVGLDLGYNQLSSLPPDIFQGLGALSLLGLRNNRLASFPDQIFQDLISLQLIDVTLNGIAGTKEDFIARYPALQNPEIEVYFDPQFAQ